MANNLNIVLAFCQYPGPKCRVGMSIDDGPDGLVADRADSLEQDFSVVLGVAGIECDQSVIRIYDRYGCQAVTTEDPNALGRLLDSGFQPGHFINTVQNFFIRNSPIGCLLQFYFSTHIGRNFLGYYRGADQE